MFEPTRARARLAPNTRAAPSEVFGVERTATRVDANTSCTGQPAIHITGRLTGRGRCSTQDGPMSRATDRALVALARTQRGLLSDADVQRMVGRPDALARCVAGGLWQEPLPGVVAAAARAVDTDLKESAAMLWVRRSMLSHFSAARRDGIWAPESDLAWLTTEFGSPARSQPGLRVYPSRQLPGAFRSDGFHRWTAADRTIVDLAGELTRAQVEAVLLSAIRLGRTTAAQVEATAVCLRGRRGVAMVKDVTQLWMPERESLLEDLLCGIVVTVVPAGVRRQHKVAGRDGRVFARLDVAVPELRLGFEADGLLFHSTDAQIARDQARDRRLMGLGWTIARFREGVLNDAAQVRRDLVQILSAGDRRLPAA